MAGRGAGQSVLYNSQGEPLARFRGNRRNVRFACRDRRRIGPTLGPASRADCVRIAGVSVGCGRMELAAYCIAAVTLGLVVARPRIRGAVRVTPAMAALAGVLGLRLLGLLRLSHLQRAAEEL